MCGEMPNAPYSNRYRAFPKMDIVGILLLTIILIIKTKNYYTDYEIKCRIFSLRSICSFISISALTPALAG